MKMKEGRKRTVVCVSCTMYTYVYVPFFTNQPTAVPVGLMFSFYLSPWSDVSLAICFLTSVMKLKTDGFAKETIIIRLLNCMETDR